MDANKTRPSLVDVAQQAGVSPATVSRVLNGTAPVSDDVRTRVLNATARLHYEHVPRSTKTSLSNAVALLIPDVLNPFFAEIVRGIEECILTF